LFGHIKTLGKLMVRTMQLKPEPQFLNRSRESDIFLTVLHANFSALLFRLLEHKDAETTFFFQEGKPYTV
jgi:hypothetical protein